jgi:hypothetical protein
MSEPLGWFGVVCAIALVLAALYAVSLLGVIARSSVRIAEELRGIADELESLHYLQARRGSETGEKPELGRPRREG